MKFVAPPLTGVWAVEFGSITAYWPPAGRPEVALKQDALRETCDSPQRPIRVLGFGYTFRTVNNYAPALAALRAGGARTSMLLTPRLDDPDARKLVRWRAESLAYNPIGSLSQDAFPRERLRRLLDRALASFEPTHILLDCTLNYPSNAVFELLAERPDRPVVVGFQQGLYQLWNVYDRVFPCDHFLCYGPMHRAQFSPERQPWVHDAGLPKLDRLRDVAATDEGYLLYIAQDTPRPEVVGLALAELSQGVGLPVFIKPHPEHTKLYDSLRPRFRFLEPGDDVVGWIARSSGVVTAGSTSGLEALMLRKPLVVLPGRPATAYENSQLVAYDFTGEAMVQVWNSQRRVPTLGDQFLAMAVGGRRFDHAQRVADAIRACTRRREVGCPSAVGVGEFGDQPERPQPRLGEQREPVPGAVPVDPLDRGDFVVRPVADAQPGEGRQRAIA